MCRQRQNLDLQDDLARTRRNLDEKNYEMQKLGEENQKKGNQAQEMMQMAAGMEREADDLKMVKADNYREIQRLKDMNDHAVREAAEKTDRLKNLDYDLSKTSQRIDDNQRFIEAKNYDLRNKQMLLDDTAGEGLRLKDMNSRLFSENQ